MSESIQVRELPPLGLVVIASLLMVLAPCLTLFPRRFENNEHKDKMNAVTRKYVKLNRVYKGTVRQLENTHTLNFPIPLMIGENYGGGGILNVNLIKLFVGLAQMKLFKLFVNYF